jgi:drug/metabolite transporter (DMT)-like permease
MKVWLTVALIAVSLAWIGFAWVLLGGVAFALDTNGTEGVPPTAWMAVGLTFLAAPMLLILLWSHRLQGHPPTRSQVWRMTLLAVAGAVILTVVVGIAFFIGWLKDSTPL